MKEEFTVLASGAAGGTELLINHDDTETHMTIHDGFIYVNFIIRDDEVHLLRAIISFASEDDKKVSKTSQSITIGKFGTFRVELVKDDEHKDCITILIGRGSISIMRSMNKDDLIAACKQALDDL